MFKPTSLIAPALLALTMVSIPSTAAERGGARGNHDPSHGRSASSHRPDRDPSARAERVFNKLDTDHNGIVTLDEYLAKSLAKAAKQFSRIDVDDDELVSLDEFLAIHHGGDGDYTIDRDALRVCIIENSDLTEDDLLLTGRPDGSARFLEIDENADGFIELAEFEFAKTSKATDKFNRIDANGDGGISLEELLAIIESKNAIRSVRRDCVQAQNDEDDLLGG
ncbi:MAG: Ca2+-binding EF-hand superfamily protein [Candidatus Azotimanducaceae bacterium]|jgi:Ca2+-binding EF-hand superfamily protein